VRYHPHTPEEIREMLAVVGVKSLDELFRSIPAPLRLKRPLQVAPAQDEIALFADLRRMAARNDVGHPPFIGAGAYPHHVPPVVDQLLLRGEFFTAYTPYQPEVSQGTLQALFEWQTYVCLLTGMEVANASMYDGASATAEAALMATRLTGRKKIVVSDALHPEYRRVLGTYLASTGDELVPVPHGADGRTDPTALARAVDGQTAAVILGHPNFFGVVEDLAPAAALVKRAGALTI
jgi:glycine dehydrogenase subunit 1